MGVWEKIPSPVRTLARLLREAGHEAYVVGGAPRDLLLGRPPHDWDLATEARPDEVTAVCGAAGLPVRPTGLAFGTVTVQVGGESYEVTTYRVEGRYRDGRRPAEVRFVPSLAADLARRDFTLNALALDPLTGRLVDPWGGARDLARGVLRTVGPPADRLAEDALRILRALRLAAELGFELAPATAAGVAAAAPALAGVARPRVGEELRRLVLGPWAADALGEAVRLGVLGAAVPLLMEGFAVPQDPPHRHTVLAHLIETVRYTPARLPLRLAALLHDAAKPRCAARASQREGRFRGHDRLGAQFARQILLELGLSGRLAHAVAELVGLHMFSPGMGSKGVRRLAARLGREGLEDLFALRLADVLAAGGDGVAPSLEAHLALVRTAREVLAEPGGFGLADLAVSGHDVLEVLGIGPGPRVGRVLQRLWEEVLADPALNTREHLRARIRELGGSPQRRP